MPAKTLSQPLEKAQESLQVAAVLSMLGARLGLQAVCICCLPDCQGLDSSILLPNKPEVSKMPFLHRFQKKLGTWLTKYKVRGLFAKSEVPVQGIGCSWCWSYASWASRADRLHRKGTNSRLSTDPVEAYWLGIKYASDNMQRYQKNCSVAAMASELTKRVEVRVKVECPGTGHQEPDWRLLVRQKHRAKRHSSTHSFVTQHSRLTLT